MQVFTAIRDADGPIPPWFQYRNEQDRARDKARERSHAPQTRAQWTRLAASFAVVRELYPITESKPEGVALQIAL